MHVDACPQIDNDAQTIHESIDTEECGLVHAGHGSIIEGFTRLTCDKQAKAVMEGGGLVSDEIVIGVAEERLSQDDARGGFVLDGFPRTDAQARALDAMLERMGIKSEFKAACGSLTRQRWKSLKWCSQG